MTAAVFAARRHMAIGGPSALSACVVVAYAVAVALAVWAVVVARRACRQLSIADPAEARRQRVMARVWVAIALVMLVLGISKQFDLESGSLALLRRIAYQGGWYERRRTYQAEFIVALVGFAIAAGAVAAFVLRRAVRRIVVVLGAVSLLVVFVIVRTISFHSVDHLLARGGRFELSGLLEGAGIALVVLASVHWHLVQRAVVADAIARSAPPPGPWTPPEAVGAGTTSAS
jgi:hypothetical protein